MAYGWWQGFILFIWITTPNQTIPWDNTLNRSVMEGNIIVKLRQVIGLAETIAKARFSCKCFPHFFSKIRILRMKNGFAPQTNDNPLKVRRRCFCIWDYFIWGKLIKGKSILAKGGGSAHGEQVKAPKQANQPSKGSPQSISQLPEWMTWIEGIFWILWGKKPPIGTNTVVVDCIGGSVFKISKWPLSRTE